MELNVSIKKIRKRILKLKTPYLTKSYNKILRTILKFRNIDSNRFRYSKDKVDIYLEGLNVSQYDDLYIKFDTDSSPIILDTGDSLSITNDCEEFIDFDPCSKNISDLGNKSVKGTITIK